MKKLLFGLSLIVAYQALATGEDTPVETEGDDPELVRMVLNEELSSVRRKLSREIEELEFMQNEAKGATVLESASPKAHTPIWDMEVDRVSPKEIKEQEKLVRSLTQNEQKILRDLLAASEEG